jgi:hypothetical protein
MELVASILFSQEPATCPYPEPDQSSSRSPRLQMFLKVQFHVIFPSPSRSSRWCLFLRFPNQNSVCISHPPPCHMPRTHTSPSWFDRPNKICWGVQIFRLLIIRSPTVPWYLVVVGPKSTSELSCQPTLFTQHSHLVAQNNWRNYISIDFNLLILDGNQICMYHKCITLPYGLNHVYVIFNRL